MNYGEFQDRWEIEASKERAAYDRISVCELLKNVQQGHLGNYHQIWYSLADRASLDEAKEPLLQMLESDADYLVRYHVAETLLRIAQIPEGKYQAVSLSARGAHPVEENLRALRQDLSI
jgi:hypothetical protein